MNLDGAVSTLAALAAGVPERAGRVRLTSADGVATLVIDNPASRNALTLRMMSDLASAVAALQSLPIVATLVVGEGDQSFCAGGQLDELLGAIDRPAAARAMCLAMGVVLDALLDSGFVTIGAVDGPAVGGGAELVTALDHPIIGGRGWVHFAQVGLGIPTGWGGARRLVGRVGRNRALTVVLGDERLDGPAAATLGLASATPGSARAACEAFAGKLRALPASGVRGLKRQVVAAGTGDRDADATAFADAWGGLEHRAALSARLGRR